MIFNIGNSDPLFDLSVSGYPGATVTITDGKKTYEKVTDSEGNAVFEKLKKGTWKATATDGSVSKSHYVEIGRDSDNALNINTVPDIVFNGTFQIVDDNDNPISRSLKDWKIRFLDTGSLTFKKLNGAVEGIDVFCVGGGGRGGYGYAEDGGSGGGGGGGFTTTAPGVSVTADKSYAINVGGSGEASSFNGDQVKALGGRDGGNGTLGDGVFADGKGGDGGSGGGAGRSNSGGLLSAGGIDGADGFSWSASGHTGVGGKGQVTTTREFGEPTGKLYASGGDGGTCYEGTGSVPLVHGSANTGNGGSGAGYNSNSTTTRSNGGSGIVIIRNKRKEESE